MNIKDIKYFIEVVELKSFTKAAEKMHVSQPAISKAIRLLEQDINVTLINREAKHFTLTKEGQTFYTNAKKANISIDLELARLQESINIKQEDVIVGVPPVIGTVYFPKIIAEFKEIHPHINLIMVEKGSNTIKAAIEDGSIDVGAVVTPVKSDKTIINHIIYGEIVVVLNKQHPLADKSAISIKELKNENFLTFTEDFMMYDKTISVCHEAGFKPEIVLKTSQWDFILEMVSLSQGITLMPRHILERFNTNNLKLLPITSPSIRWNVAIITKKNKYLSNAVNLFINHIVQYTTLQC
ncbi:MAG: LysR family transcriptional regulator [Eubacteriales bacterium]